jgi:hypothetical protein
MNNDMVQALLDKLCLDIAALLAAIEIAINHTEGLQRTLSVTTEKTKRR